jgi:dihydropteroate synthase
MVQDGADIIDVGGESTRPFAEPVSCEEEIARVIPVIEAIRAKSDAFVSIDTYKSEVARAAVEAGAGIVNDISGLSFDENMAGTVAELGVDVVIMHIRGTPRNMQTDPHYDDVIEEIKGYFVERLASAREHGIEEERIIIDPGIGFGKRLEDNLRIIKSLRAFKELGRPLLVGTSMKTFIGQVLDAPPEERTEGTLASIVISLWNGADIVRVHDVPGALKVVKLVNAVMRS